MEKENLTYTPMVALYFITDQIPEEVYDRGDEVLLYDLDYLTGQSNQGRLIPIPRPTNGECSICYSPFNDQWNYCPCCGQEYKEK